MNLTFGPINVHTDPAINRKLDMVLIAVNELKELIMTVQEKADAFAARVVAFVANIRQDIADLKASNPEVDFTKLENSISGGEKLAEENPSPTP